jgi:hypothetical protein
MCEASLVKRSGRLTRDEIRETNDEIRSTSDERQEDGGFNGDVYDFGEPRHG